MTGAERIDTLGNMVDAIRATREDLIGSYISPDSTFDPQSRAELVDMNALVMRAEQIYVDALEGRIDS